MGWFGTLIGSSIGFVFGGPLGAIGGAALGHILIDRPTNRAGGVRFNRQETRQAGYFVALFSLMGKIAAADGVITANEKRIVRQFIAQSHMNATQGDYAMRIFEEAGGSPHSVRELVNQFHLLTVGHSKYHLNFMGFLVRIAVADGVVDEKERGILQEIARGLHIGDNDFRVLLNNAASGEYRGGSQYSASRTDSDTLQHAYKTLGCTPQNSESEIRAAYRSLATAYHPDKIIAKDLPEEFTELANKKFQDIQASYEQIKSARNIR